MGGFEIPPNSGASFLGLSNTTTAYSLRNNDYQIVHVEFNSFPSNDWDPKVEHVGININSLAPEYVRTRRASKESDVYSFGSSLLGDCEWKEIGGSAREGVPNVVCGMGLGALWNGKSNLGRGQETAIGF